MNKRFVVWATLLVITTLFTSCASIAVSRSLQNYRQTLDPLVGSAKKEALEAKFGFPDRVNTFPDRELWHYFSLHSYYARDIFNPALGYNPVYDSLTMEFDANGVLRKWKAQVAR